MDKTALEIGDDWTRRKFWQEALKEWDYLDGSFPFQVAQKRRLYVSMN